jgi:hypothetical protein
VKKKERKKEKKKKPANGESIEGKKPERLNNNEAEERES